MCQSGQRSLPAHLGPWHPAPLELGLGGSRQEAKGCRVSEFPGETAGPARGGFQTSAEGSSELFRHPLPLPPFSSPSVASMAFTTRSCSSNMTPRPLTSCSWCAPPETSRRATWWKWCCRVRGEARLGAEPRSREGHLEGLEGRGAQKPAS